ncbi:PKD domain-containing protein [Baekduia soli]|uniref:PKD domain-containing protein n=1 Tax=Baekduia soli TaxID=496014 RepID=UPI001651C959|nr:PKD domain-containing protein [Baekduia soli]
MPRRLALIVTSLAALAAAAPAHAAFFAGEAIDGPSADIRSVGDLDIARDGTGAVAYVRRDAGVDHVFVSRLVGGAWQPPERVDPGLDTPSSQPAVAASDGGRVAVAYVSGGQQVVAVRPAGAAAFAPPQGLGAGASSPSIDMSINGVAYVTWTANGDVLAARLDRGAQLFAPLPAPLDIDPAAVAGVGANRSKVAIAADGTAVATWGEAGHVYARRLYGTNVSTAPLDLTLPDFDGHAGGAADSPDVDIEDDSSFAWISFRQQFADGATTTARAVGRRLRGSRLEDPVVYDPLGWGGQGVASTDVDLNGKGEGVLTAGTTDGSAVAAVLKDDALNAGVGIGGNGPPAQPVGAIAETTDRVVGWVGAGDGTVHGVFYDDKPNVRTVPGPGPDTLLTDPNLGAVDSAAGFDVAGDRTGDFAFVFIQGAGDQRRLVSAVYDRLPGTFRISTSSRIWRNVVKAPVAWGSALDLWGPLTFTVLVDGKPVATTQDTKSLIPAGAVADGLHTWRVVATDRRNQTVTTAVKPLKVDTTAPKVTFSIRRTGRVATVTAKAADVLPPSGKAAGVKYVRIDFGDGSRFVQAVKTTHRYRRTGRFVVRVSATDNAGNVTVARRTLRIGRA